MWYQLDYSTCPHSAPCLRCRAGIIALHQRSPLYTPPFSTIHRQCIAQGLARPRVYALQLCKVLRHRPLSANQARTWPLTAGCSLSTLCLHLAVVADTERSGMLRHVSSALIPCRRDTVVPCCCQGMLPGTRLEITWVGCWKIKTVASSGIQVRARSCRNRSVKCSSPSGPMESSDV
jgi:hypothetical protein